VKIYKINTLTDFNQKNLCLTVGNFDGIHKGHQYVIDQVIKNSAENNLQSAILSFNPHPKKFFDKSLDQLNILTKKKKLSLLNELGVSIYLDFVFDLNLSSLTAEDFVELILIKKLDTKLIVIGADFRFGKERSGDMNLLIDFSKKYNFKVKIIEPVKVNNSDEKYSSSKIRKQIENGLFEEVSIALGREWEISGKVIKGDQRAREINFPTANIMPSDNILPKKGVYCVNAIIDNKRYLGISNFGERPTVEGKKLLLETHIFNFNDDIYGKELTVEFLTFIRPEQKFDNFEKLTEQIKKDIVTAKSYHKI